MKTVVDVTPQAIREFELDGLCQVPSVFSKDACDAFATALSQNLNTEAALNGTRKLRRGDETYALRGVLSLVPELRADDFLAPLRRLATALLGRPAFIVRSLLFDKSPSANWNIRWHQDCTIAVKQKREIAGFGPWSSKAGVPHVRASAKVLEGMIALRVHLDPCDASNGALRVLPGGHKKGILDSAALQAMRECVTEHTTDCDRGDVLAMRPLLPHASAAATKPNHRRVIHLEFACNDLPKPLTWYERA